MGKKERLAKILMQSWVERLLVQKKRRHLSILAYHSVQEFTQDYPYNAENISAYPNVFAEQMDFVSKHFNVINFYDLVRYQSAYPNLLFPQLLKLLPPNSMIITFDDGYADNLNIALPIMKSYGLTGVVYISTDFVDQQKLFWFDEVARCMQVLPEGPINIFNNRFSVHLNDTNREKQRRAFGRFLQTLTDNERLEAIEELRHISQYNFDSCKFSCGMPLSWEQVRQLRSEGIEIGSHTRNHGFLDVMNEEELLDQIAGSKEQIESQIGESIVSFSYPNGNFHQGVVDTVKEAGYQFAVNYKHNIAKSSIKLNRFLLPRLHVETDMSMSLFKGNLLMPSTFVR
ncbi:MAG TPA: hypothetical protein DHW71_01720 [Gammaproteobacteria bacterium]|nr:hypothetical protein [Gammaproteobacteria bacterium]HBF07620.1 hypothetical protein [Gammaproteobacteria bacterium]HCK91671.1 hypothetical protein [Gammaproteobacteria bacterium]|tara:strand:- start:301 stop:1329 length:1029 start_codon:yes stop_codon:yes gene_type:complete